MLDPAVLPLGVAGVPDVSAVSDTSGSALVLCGRYRVLERVGRGGMADVYAAEDEVLGRPVAVKVFRVDAATGAEGRRIDAESRMLASFTHPGLVTVYDAGTCVVGGELSPFMVMELVNGPSLRRCLDDGPLGPEPTALLGAELAAALVHVHARGIVHRDVKPANILLTTNPGDGARASVKLADFGIARAVEAARLTTDGSTIGTANYLSPEQVESGDVTAASDVYSLGLVLLECLTGVLAYPGAGVQAAVARLHRQPVVPTHLGGPWIRLLTRMTSREPAERPTAAEVATQLRALCGRRAPVPAEQPDPAEPKTQTHTGPVAARVPSPRAAGSWSRRRWAAGLGLLVVLVPVSLALLAARPAHHRAPSPRPAYPAVTGQLGADLRRLEGAVSGSGVPAQLGMDLRVLVASAAAHQYPAAYSALGDLRVDLAADGAEGSVGAAQIARIRAAMAPVQEDLMAATTATASPTGTATASTTAAARTAAGTAHSATPVARTPAKAPAVHSTTTAKAPKPGKAKKHPPKKPGPGPGPRP
jgi:tRNA A-37 threonylcarbamoyl transferase component Bud32